MPTLDRILVQRVKAETKTASGIFLPSSVTEKQVPEATVLAVGPGARDRDGKIMPMEFKAGDKVLLPSYGGQSIKEYHLFRDSEILAKFS
ncbi:chaperonin GroS [Puccinia sorghi]|uniref:Chaperonin GroS n=1 Tax=Puccinia sorghi TaxID=27349 RepID=A0A0L6V6Q2_9BASI|nr:chaperonin GroS [Puccinia sorghi]